MEFIIFFQNYWNLIIKKLKFQVRISLIDASSKIKFLGVSLDQNLKFQIEKKTILQEWALGSKSVYTRRDISTQIYKFALKCSSCHLHWSAILTNGISESFISAVEK